MSLPDFDPVMLPPTIYMYVCVGEMSHLWLWYLEGTTGYAELERKQVHLSRRRASDRALTVSGPQGNYILYIGGDNG